MKQLSEIDLEELRGQINGLATAKECPVVYVEQTEQGNVPKSAEEYKAVVNEKTGAVECIASKGYVVIQHKQAFDAVLDAVAAASRGAKFRASVMEQNGRAWMTVVFSDVKADDGLDGIELGIRVTNSYDKTCALKYSGTGKQNLEGHFEFFGLRLACMNGMTIRVNLGDISKLNLTDKHRAVGDVVLKKEFKVDKADVQTVKTYIKHFGKNTQMDMDRVADMFMALPVVVKRLEEQIRTVKGISLTSKEAEARLVELGFGERTTAKVLARFRREEMTAWGLYNAITAHATHESKVSPLSMERTLNRAQGIMEMTAKQGKGNSPSSAQGVEQ